MTRLFSRIFRAVATGLIYACGHIYIVFATRQSSSRQYIDYEES